MRRGGCFLAFGFSGFPLGLAAARMISTSAMVAGCSSPFSSVVTAFAAIAAICSGVWCAVAMACRVAGSSFAASFMMI